MTFGIYCLENKIYKNKKIVKYINKKEKEIIDKKRNDKYTKEINTFKEFNKQVPKVPKNFYKFINRKVMNGYALYNNKNHQAYCTTCQNKFNIKKLKREENSIKQYITVDNCYILFYTVYNEGGVLWIS